LNNLAAGIAPVSGDFITHCCRSTLVTFIEIQTRSALLVMDYRFDDG
jgi:hypothetical protein